MAIAIGDGIRFANVAFYFRIVAITSEWIFTKLKHEVYRSVIEHYKEILGTGAQNYDLFLPTLQLNGKSQYLRRGT